MSDRTSTPVAAAPPIAGLSFRHPVMPRDWTPLAELATRANLADGVEELPTADDLAVDWGGVEGMDPERDILYAELDGRPVGYVAVRMLPRDDVLALEIWGDVVAESRRRGIGTTLHRWARDHLAARAAADRRAGVRVFRGFAMEQQVGTIALLEAEGFTRIRHGFEMRRFLTGRLPVHALPAGLEQRPVEAAHHRAIHDAADEAFADHWGHHPATEEDFVRLFAHPSTDTSLWAIAWDGDAVAGGVITTIFREENETLGVRRAWLDRVFVRRPWRGSGVAKALTGSTLEALRGQGIEEAWLGVDGANPTGALGLYESLGFGVAQRWLVFDRPLDGTQSRSPAAE